MKKKNSYPLLSNAFSRADVRSGIKVLKSKYGYDKINYVRNITDVDDKIIISSKEKNISITELTNNIIIDFNKDCNYLNLDNPTQQPKATEHIDLMIKMISSLIENNEDEDKKVRDSLKKMGYI